jgi:hypothetical protein
MTEYYKESLEKGLKYQDFVINQMLYTFGIPIMNYSSKYYQNSLGENIQGIEIKFDDKYDKTGNLYIEIAEKSNPNNPYYVKSGIYRDDNSWLYLIGNYSIIFIFGKNILVRMHKAGRYKEVSTPTSKGFLLNKEAQEYALKTIDCTLKELP